LIVFKDVRLRPCKFKPELGRNDNWRLTAIEMLKFFDWSYRAGAKLADELQYVPMPKDVVQMIESAWAEFALCRYYRRPSIPGRRDGLVWRLNSRRRLWYSYVRDTLLEGASFEQAAEEPAIANGFREPRMQRIPRIDHDFHVNKIPIVAVTEGRGAQDMVALVLRRKIG
jgi:hypothetical protein